MLMEVGRLGWFSVDDRTMLPRYWAAVWCMLDLNSLAGSTRSKLLRGADALYQHTDREFGCGALDDAFTDLDLGTLGQMLEAFYFRLKNGTRSTNEPVDSRWSSAVRFVREVSIRLDQTFDSESLLAAIESRFDRLERLHTGLTLGPRPPAAPIRALPASVVEELYAILSPGNDRNPFRGAETRWRAFTVFVLLLHQGLRQGEALILPVSCLRSELDSSGRTVHWLDVRESEEELDDPRYSKPSIKTVNSVRPIPVTPLTAGVLKRYRTDWRRRQPHAFFLASKNKLPLSKEGLAWYLRAASACLSPAAKKSLLERTRADTVSPHDLRHTCATVRMRQLLDHGMGLSEASQQLRSFFGWSMESDMPRHYAKAAFEDRLTRVWGDQFDQRIAMLRALPE